MILCPTNCSTPHVKRPAPCHLPRSTTQNGSARAARQALLSEAAARSGPLEPKLGTQNACVRSVRQASHLPQMRRDNLQARRHTLLGPKLMTQNACVRSVRQVPIFRRCDGSSFKQEGTRPRAHPPLRSLVCCVDIGTGARSAAKMSTACLRRFVEGGRNGLWPRDRERFFRGPQHGAFVRIRTRLTWEHTLLAPPKSSTAPKGFIRPRPLCWSGFLWLEAVWSSRYVEELFAPKL